MNYSNQLDIQNSFDSETSQREKEQILHGLLSLNKNISPKYFYDEYGSKLFEEITRCPEYYQTKCELEILSNIVDRLDLDFKDLDIIELGSGESSKISNIFRQIPANVLRSIRYFPVDICESAINDSIKDIIEEFNLDGVFGIVADFLVNLNLPLRNNKRLICFFGSTIGNFSESELRCFMSNIGNSMQKGDVLMLGADMVKDIDIIERAYNDSEGITDIFNKNVLDVMNRELGADFDKSNFEHLAYYDKGHERIEMHLKSMEDQRVYLGEIDEYIILKKDETIHTEDSHKFTLSRLRQIGEYGGLKMDQILTDDKSWFSEVIYLK